jgi:hypothetical protein
MMLQLGDRKALLSILPGEKTGTLYSIWPGKEKMRRQ